MTANGPPTRMKPRTDPRALIHEISTVEGMGSARGGLGGVGRLVVWTGTEGCVVVCTGGLGRVRGSV